ncbi:MAG: MFS transporter [Planctomycetota bacterium]
MPDLDLDHALDSPLVVATLWGLGILMVLVLVREMRRIPARLLVLMFSAFVDMVGLLMLVPLLPFYVQRLGGDGVRVLGLSLDTGLLTGVVIVAFTLAQSLSAPRWGRFSDRFGRRPTLLVALGASAAGYLIFGFADSIALLLLSRVVQGAGGGTVGVIQAYVADSTAPEQRARALGWLSAATNLGVALGPVLGSQAVKLGDVDLAPGSATLQLGRAAPGVVAALLCVLNMVFAAVYLKESNTERAHDPQRPRVRTRAAMLEVLTRIRLPSSRLILIYAVAIGAFQGIGGTMVLFLERHLGFTEETIGYLYMYIGAISVFTRVLLLGRMVDRFGEARLSRLGVLLLAAGMLALPFTTGLLSLALAVGMLPLGTAFTFPCVTSLLSRVIGQQDRGLYMGLQQTYGGLLKIVLPLMYGWAFDRLGISVPFFVAAALVLATLPLGVGMGRYARDAQEAAR